MTGQSVDTLDLTRDAMSGWMGEDVPLQHAFVVLGKDPLFLSHLTMFHMPEHRFQMIVSVRLDKISAARLEKDRQANPSATYFLGNTAAGEFKLTKLASGRAHAIQADLFRGIPDQPYYTEWPWKGVTPLIGDITVEVARIVYFRQFDVDIPAPEDLTYILFGSERMAHLAHHQTAWPDFDHVITLAQRPEWIDVEEIESGVPITFRGLKTRPRGALHCKDPLPAGTYEAHYDGAGHLPAAGTQGPIVIGRSDWFSTKIVNIPNDPCYRSGPAPTPPHHPPHAHAAAPAADGQRISR
jgi:hypothetical protein